MVQDVQCVSDGVPLEDRVNKRIRDYLRSAEGRLLTFVEAITEYDEQLKARRDMVRNLLWQDSFFMYEHIKGLVQKEIKELESDLYESKELEVKA